MKTDRRVKGISCLWMPLVLFKLDAFAHEATNILMHCLTSLIVGPTARLLNITSKASFADR